MNTQPPPSDSTDCAAVAAHLMGLQDSLCARLEAFEPTGRFDARELPAARGGTARPRVLGAGLVFDRAAVNFSHTQGQQLPPAATEARPQLAGSHFDAVSLSIIVHPHNPFAPTSHANFRFFRAQPRDGGEAVWWFGGGFDLTPYYGFEDDVLHWHRTAREACDAFDPGLYPRLKRQCDEYFYLPHRQEPRGVGGLFFDDYQEGGFAHAFAFVRRVSEAFPSAYLPLVQRRKDTPFTQENVEWQHYRRGRYVEFNLLHDRGTRYGLQAGGRVESILASLPPHVAWRYDWKPAEGSDEARLLKEFLVPRNWLAPSDRTPQ